MSTILFGGTVSLINSATPSSGGYLIGYDTDGILKQKDSSGNIEVIGGGLTGSSGTSSLVDTLSIGNETGSYNIIMGTSTSILSSNGNGQISLDYTGTSSNISITTNDGAEYGTLDINPNLIRLLQTNGNTFSRITLNSNTASIVIGNSTVYTNIQSEQNVFDVSFNNTSLLYGNISILESGTTYDSGSLNKAFVHINSFNASTDNGIQNSVIIGGSNINANESETVYVPQLVIQDSKVIKGSKGSSLVKLSEWSDVILVNTNQNSIIGIISSTSSESYISSSNGILLVDSITNSVTPNLASAVSAISTQNSSISYGIENSVLIGGNGLSASQSNTVYLGNNVNINNQYTLPNSDGSNGQILKTDGSGNVTWQSESTTSATQSLYDVLAVNNDTISENIIMGTSTSIRSGNSGGSIFLDNLGTSGDVLISTDNGGLSTSYINIDTTDITLDSNTGELSINTSDSIIVTGNGEGLKYGFDYTSGFVTYSLVSKGYVDSKDISTLSLSNGLTGSFTGGSLSISSEVNSDSIEIDGNNQISLKSTIVGNRQFDDSVTILGNLTVLGTSSTINTENLYVEDNIITLNATYSGPAVIDAGVEVNLGDGTYSKILWDSSIGYWQVGLSGSESTIITEGDNGLTKSNSKIILGGTLSQSTQIHGDSKDLLITNLYRLIFTASNYMERHVYSSNYIEDKITYNEFSSKTYLTPLHFDIKSGFDTGGTYSQVYGQTNRIDVVSYNGNSDASIISLFSTGQTTTDGTSDNRMVITDTEYQKGLVYNGDYTSNFSTYSLVTKGYVDSIGLSTPSLGQVLAVGNTSSGYNIEISNTNYLLYRGLTYSTRLVLDYDSLTSDRINILSNASGKIVLVDDSGVGNYDAEVNYYPKWTSGFTLATSSMIYDNGTNLHLGGLTSSILDSYGVNYKASLTNFDNSTVNLGLVVDVNNGAAGNYGIFTNLTLIGLSQSTNYGLYNQIDVDDVSEVYGIRSEITGTSSSSQPYGLYNSINIKNTENVVGFLNSVTGGTTQKIGIMNQMLDYNSQDVYGIYNSVRRGSSETYGIYMPISGTSGDVYGISITHANNVGTTSNPSYNIFIDDRSYSSNKYGNYIYLSGNNSSSYNYGTYLEVSGGTDSNYGIYTKLSGNLGTNYGLYIDSYSASNSYGVVVHRGTSIFNQSGENYDFTISGENNSNLFFVDASVDKIGIGTNAPVAELDVRGSAVINNAANSSYNFTVKGSLDSNLLVTNASANAAGVGGYSSNTKFSIASTSHLIALNAQNSNGTASGTNYAITSSSTTTNTGTNYGLYVDTANANTNYGVVVNRGTSVFNFSGSADSDFRIAGDTNANLFFADASTDRVGIKTPFPTYDFTVVGTVSSTTGFNTNGLNGWSGTFSADGQIVTVTGGIITSVT